MRDELEKFGDSGNEKDIFYFFGGGFAELSCVEV
jgi:hypothetical protein